jgi:hypothetical protein
MADLLRFVYRSVRPCQSAEDGSRRGGMRPRSGGGGERRRERSRRRTETGFYIFKNSWSAKGFGSVNPYAWATGSSRSAT